MSERKVLTKYYPPDFDPSKITRTKGPKNDKLPTVRLMTPFSMRCTRCGTFIPKAKKFNARKEVPEGDKYLGIQRFRFYFRCPGCSGEISFKTDPKNMDYEAEIGAQRNFEPWRIGRIEETDEERLQRLEAEEQDIDPMKDLETKMHDAQRDMAVADALDEIRAQNARNEKAAEVGEVATVQDVVDDERQRQDAEDAETARLVFQRLKESNAADNTTDEMVEILEPTTNAANDIPKIPKTTPAPTFKRTVKPKKNFSAALGIKRKAAA
jgi:Saf4/Yju2 protein